MLASVCSEAPSIARHDVKPVIINVLVELERRRSTVSVPGEVRLIHR